MTKHSENNAEFIQFYDEIHPQTDETTAFDPKKTESKGWKVIIADDEEAVHTMTKWWFEIFSSKVNRSFFKRLFR